MNLPGAFSGHPQATGAADIPSLPDARFAGLLRKAKDSQQGTVDLRRKLHQEPEVGLRLPETQAAILDALLGLPLEIQLGKSSSSITAVLRGKRTGPSVLLRADMDALSTQENTGLEYASRRDGLMHACGHDGHAAMLVAAARLLTEHVDELAGSVVFMFQPGEEGHDGARHMIHEGVLEAAGSRVERAFALHLYPNLPSGHIATKQGAMMASDDSFAVTVLGKGGHGAVPHLTVDPISAIAAMVSALQTMITRRVDIAEPAVLSVTWLSAGSMDTVIPETAEMEGTIRTLSERTKALMREEIPKVCEGIAQAHGCRLNVAVNPGYPVTVNDPQQAQRVLALAGEVLGSDHVAELTKSLMTAEDFSYIAQRVPGTLALLGACPPGEEPAEAFGLHSNQARFDEDAFPFGVAMYAAFALDALR